MNRQPPSHLRPIITRDSSKRLSGIRLASVLATAALVGTACGTTSESTSGDDGASPVVQDTALDTPAPSEQTPDAQRSTETATTPTRRNVAVITGTESSTASSSDEATDADSDGDPSSTPDTTTGLGLGIDPSPGPDPDPDPDPDPSSEIDDFESPPSTADCGNFGPIPPRPDSMPTELYDTDGDGAADDEVTAYGSDTWVLRVVENGATSEAAMPNIMGWAFISNDYKVDGRDFIEVTDNDLGTIYTFATVDGCTELLDTRLPIDDLAPTPALDPAPEGSSDLVATPGACGQFGDGPPLAGIVSEIFVDLAGDGSHDDHVMTYRDDADSWKMRATVGGVTSEVDIEGVGPGWAQVLGTVDVGEITPGDEIIANVGASASSTLIGMFGLDDSNCLFRFIDNTDSPLTMYSGATIGGGSQFFCGTGYVGQGAWSLEDDDTYFMSGYALIESSPGKFTYMPASDGFAEGLSESELPTHLFDCNDLTL